MMTCEAQQLTVAGLNLHDVCVGQGPADFLPARCDESSIRHIDDDGGVVTDCVPTTAAVGRPEIGDVSDVGQD